MFRNNLFIKICLSFWLTTLFMIGAVLTVDWLIGAGPFHANRPFPQGPFPPLSGQALVWIYEQEGPAALQAFTDHLKATTGIRMRLLDAKGVELTEPAPAAASDKVAPVPPVAGAPVPLPAEKGIARKATIAGAQGRTYTLLEEGLPPFPPPPGPGGPHDPWSTVVIRLLAVLAVSGLICYLLARYLTAPLLKLKEAARRFAAGDLAVRVRPKLGRRSDEISRLALDFDLMAERIESLLRSQRTLLRDISHELRSPLARLNVALAFCRTGSEQEVARSLDRIEREADRLNEMIGHLLTLNRVESGIAPGEKKAIDLAALVREVAADAEFEAKAANRKVELAPLAPCVIEGDAELLRRAIDNVARNAVRYTAEGTAVEIALRSPGQACERIVIAIRDHGPGVPEAALPHLFTPFYRVGDGRERATGGTGLGLAITETAVRLHGGTVTAANAGGGGLVVEIAFPCA